MSSIGLNHEYQFQNDEYSYALQEVAVADALSKYLVREYSEELRYDRSAKIRRRAARKITNYARSRSDLYALVDAARYDENPTVRATARSGLSYLLKL